MVEAKEPKNSKKNRRTRNYMSSTMTTCMEEQQDNAIRRANLLP